MTEIDPMRAPGARADWSAAEIAVLEAVKTCCERWGVDKVTVDDIAKQAGVSRATLYRLFPGGKDVVFDAHRVYELDQFFEVLLAHIDGAETLERLLVRAITCAMRELRADEHLAIMLASEPGAVVSDLTVDGLPRIIRVASAYLVPLLDPYMARPQSRALVDVLVRLVVSYFLAPSELVDLTDPDETRTFVTSFIPTPDPIRT
jgi:AcrR family transcriptional regulator